MTVLMISSDRSLFQEGSAARQRMVEYGELVDELHIIVFSRQNFQFSTLNFQNIYIYPTNSRNRLFYIFDAIKVGGRIIQNSPPKADQPLAEKLNIQNYLITSQDPFECGLAGWFLKRKFGVSLQLQIHTDFLSPYFRQESILNKIRVLMAKFLIPRADCVRVVSQRIKNSLIQNSKLKIKNLNIITLPIFIDIDKIRNAPIKIGLHKKYPQFDFIILTASRLTKEKNIGLAIGAMAEIVKKYPKAGLLIIGSGPEEKNLSLFVARYGLRNNIIFEPWTDDIISYYKTADLFLLTSNYEGYGMAVVEAMAAECPVIMTDVGLAGEVLIDKRDGIVAPVGGKEKLTEAIISLLENPDLREKITENAGKTLNFWPAKKRYLRSYYNSWLVCRPEL